MPNVAPVATVRIERDALLIYAAGFLRSATVSLVGVTLAIHLADVGFTATQIGLLIGVGLAGSSLATVMVSLRGDLWGRRRILISLALLSAVGYLALAAFTSAAALVPLAFVGMLNGMGRDRGAASALDQAILPETVPDERRTWALACTTWSWTLATPLAPWLPRFRPSSCVPRPRTRRPRTRSRSLRVRSRCASASCRTPG